jgi:hypothetical protein
MAADARPVTEVAAEEHNEDDRAPEHGIPGNPSIEQHHLETLSV